MFNSYGSDRDTYLWLANQRRELNKFEEANNPLNYVSYSSLSQVPTIPSQSTRTGQMANNLKDFGQAAQGAGSLFGGIGSLVDSIWGNINKGKQIDNQADQFQKSLNVDISRIAQQDRQFQASLALDTARMAQQGDQFNQQMAFRTDQMDRMWTAARQNGLSSPFAMQAPARINPTGSNDGFVNLGNYAIQTAFN